MPTEPEQTATTPQLGLAGRYLPTVLAVAGLRKSYGTVQAVRDVSFSVQQGEIVALLGPNGAGKTTTLEILEGSAPAMAARPKFSALTQATGPVLASCVSGPGWSCRTSRSSRT